MRKLGFEETPDYDFLRELFAKVIKSNGELEDGVFDWNLLNGKLSRPSLSNNSKQGDVIRWKRLGSRSGMCFDSHSRMETKQLN